MNKRPTTSTDGIEERFKNLVVQNLGCDPRKVTNCANIIDTLGADSLDAIGIVLDSEEEFGVEIHDDEVEIIETVGDAIKLIRRKLS